VRRGPLGDTLPCDAEYEEESQPIEIREKIEKEREPERQSARERRRRRGRENLMIRKLTQCILTPLLSHSHPIPSIL
jgi:hypothetical protein